MTKLVESQLAALEALGLGNRTDISEVVIKITATDWPSVTVVTQHETFNGMAPFFQYVSEDFVLLPKDDAGTDPIPS